MVVSNFRPLEAFAADRLPFYLGAAPPDELDFEMDKGVSRISIADIVVVGSARPAFTVLQPDIANAIERLVDSVKQCVKIRQFGQVGRIFEHDGMSDALLGDGLY